MKRIASAAWILPVLLVLSHGAAGASDIEAQARAIEGKLMAPCCMANTVAEHHSGIALEMRQEIREMLGQGQTSDQIMAHYTSKHGDKILAMPTAQGFNLLVWLLPIVLLVVGPVLVYLVVRGWASKNEVSTGEPAAPIDPKYAARLERGLAELE